MEAVGSIWYNKSAGIAFWAECVRNIDRFYGKFVMWVEYVGYMKL